MRTARSFADELVRLSVEAKTVAGLDKLLQLARTWIEVADRVEDGDCHYESVDRAWLAARRRAGLGDPDK